MPEAPWQQTKCFKHGLAKIFRSHDEQRSFLLAQVHCVGQAGGYFFPIL